MKVMPLTGALFAGGMLAIVGLPPFGIFISEFALFRAGFAANQPWLMGVVLILLAIVFVSMIRHLNSMLYGPPPPDVSVGEPRDWRFILFAIDFAALVVLGLALPRPVGTLLNQVVSIVVEQ
jgi:hydrogenase-4 component F